ncbi:MAG: MarR family EPS-associated transcriptional regulator [Campylobacterales bacterium]
MHQDELTLQILRKSELAFLNPKRLTISTNKNALIDKGLIKADAIPQVRGQNFATAKKKKKYKYLLTKKGIEEKVKLTEKFVERKKNEYDQLQAELEAYRQSELV